jgi:hypothetical protein
VKKMNKLNITKRQALAVITAVLIVISATSLIVYAAATTIWSPSSTPTTATAVAFSGTLGQVTFTDSNPAHSGNNPSQTSTGDTLTLTTPLSPAPARAQSVSFWYSNSAITVSGGVPTHPEQLSGINEVSSTGSTASTTFIIPDIGTYYFIAKIMAPS